ncbi:MAG: hypothetical protein V3U54_07705 [Thermodesulfobacteriota bacterium]
MKTGMTPDGIFDYYAMVIEGIGDHYKLAPGRGADILAINKAINRLGAGSVGTKNPITIDTQLHEEFKKLIGQIDNLKYTERIGNEQK